MLRIITRAAATKVVRPAPLMARNMATLGGNVNPLTAIKQRSATMIQPNSVPSCIPAASGVASALAQGSTATLPFLTPFSGASQRRYVRGIDYQPSVRKRKRSLGFLARSRSRTGRKIIKRRTLKGRWFLTH
ncbi:ribosomal protein L34-domain-containing protein [Yarrowia lipolytica]|jgi:large subunit ribosomal protein L34|nr:hypothetical protein YALI1_D15963g [Yarrowia lipolytica]KAB8285186.1 ribosomal protein L34-domain-containing protein [Yarrowia lipolytica]KAE8171232.1 ribosomal protein L34-domain-containing protein [Yarrowia lipolytica]QNP98416.1 54S ribosomal protein L34 [Yarrowia lipolytica]RDW25177.1 ribosomal protein L34-domain-containing protein [Yarrowia lipolytica]